MSLWKYIFDSNLTQRADLERLDAQAEHLQASLDRARSRTRSAESEIRDLRRETARLTLVVEALTRLLEERNLCTRKELARRIQEVDLEDGKEDGRFDPPAIQGPMDLRQCLGCAQKTPAWKQACQYCGRVFDV
jgi:hypothetical protein